MSLPDRYWAKVEKSGDCWIWQAAKTDDGYGRFILSGVVRLAHRLSYVDAQGGIPPGQELDHRCRNRACVNPAHLEPVTHAENVRRGNALARALAHFAAKTCCVRGHAFDEANTYIRKEGQRQCRKCNALRAKARRSPA